VTDELSITRTQFREAIEHGIKAAGADISMADQAALYRLADTATCFGTNFTSEPVGCPVSQLGYYAGEDGSISGNQLLVSWGERFARAFDQVWANVLRREFSYPTPSRSWKTNVRALPRPSQRPCGHTA
jgi:hypothetical protein